MLRQTQPRETVSRVARRLQGHSGKRPKLLLLFRHQPHVSCTQCILRPLSRIRAELAGEFSLAIR
jgi:hypothetical protein